MRASMSATWIACTCPRSKRSRWRSTRRTTSRTATCGASRPTPSASRGRSTSPTRSRLKAIEAAALLHDMGKLAVPEHILNKPGKLTEAEFEKMKLHVDVGADILSLVGVPLFIRSLIVLLPSRELDCAFMPNGILRRGYSDRRAHPFGRKTASTRRTSDRCPYSRPHDEASRRSTFFASGRGTYGMTRTSSIRSSGSIAASTSAEADAPAHREDAAADAVTPRRAGD